MRASDVLRPRTLILAVGTFVIGTDAFVVAGVLPDLQTRFGVDARAIGALVTVFAITYAVASPVLGAATSHWERRRLLLTALTVFTIGNVLAASSMSYAVMVLARVISGVGAAMFTPIAAATATMLVAPEARARALALVGAGLTVATVIGVPAMTLLGARMNFRLVFATIAAAAVLAAVLLRMTLPPLPGQGGATLAERVGVIRLPGVLSTLLVSTCAFVGGFTVYNFIAPLFIERLGIDASAVTWLLLAFGVGGAFGNLLGGQLADRLGADRTVAVGLVLATGGLVLVAVLGGTWLGATLAIVLWGAGGWMQVPAQQHRLVSVAGSAAPIAISLNASSMYLGIGLAGVIGGVVIDVGGVGGLAPFGAVLGVTGLATVLACYRLRESVAATGGA